jgi:type I restriction enzyme S subunit
VNYIDKWPLISLEEVCSLEYGASLPSIGRNNGTIPVYGSNGIVGHHNAALADGPSIVIGRKGSIGETHLVARPFWPIDTTYYTIHDGDRINIEYLFHFLASSHLSEMNKATGVPGLNRNDVYKLLIPIPPLDEQKRIVDRIRTQIATLSDIRDRITKKKLQVQGLRDAVLFDAFSRVRPLSADTGYKQAPHGWRWTSLRDLARLESGHTPSRSHPEWWDGVIPWIALPDIREVDGKEILDTAEKTNDLGLANSSARLLPKGTVVMSRTASVGFVTVMGRPMSTSQDFVNWVCGPELDPWFLTWSLIAARSYLLDLASGAIHKTIYMPTVASFQICAPPVEEQRLIVESLRKKLAHLDRAKAMLEMEQYEAEKLQPALLRTTFSSQL